MTTEKETKMQEELKKIDVHKVLQGMVEHFAGILYDREKMGIPLRIEIERKLQSLPSGEVLVLDFSGIEDITASVADEIGPYFVLRLMNGDFGDRFVVYKCGNNEISHALQLAFERWAGKVAALSLDQGRTYYGKLSPALEYTLNKVQEKATVTPSQLCETEGSTLNIWSNRLKSLYNLRLVKRVEAPLEKGGGRQFLYSKVF